MRGSAALLLLLLGCDSGSSAATYTLPCEGSGGVDSEVHFDHEAMLCIELSMNAADFQIMAAQQRWGETEDELWDGAIGHLLADCTAPFPDPYTWFEADLVVDGEPLDWIAVRKKGFVGSALDGALARPSMKLDTDRFVDDQTLGDTEHITLNNNLTDSSRLHTCLSTSVFDDAGYPAPRCNLANLMINGQPLGSYTHVEALKKDFLERAFGDDSGHLYEGTIADFTPDHLAGTPTSLGRWEAKTDDTDAAGDPLWGVAEALQAPDEELEAALDEVLNLERFFTFWALETLLAHTDGYAAGTNNFYVYFDPDDDGRATLIPWGMDDAMSAGAEVAGTEWLDKLFVSSELTRRLSLHPELSQRYTDELARILDEVWDEERLLERVALLSDQVRSAEDRGSYDDQVATLEAWIEARRGAMEALIDRGTPEGEDTPGDCYSRLGADDIVAESQSLSALAHGCGATPLGPRAALLVLAGLFLLSGRAHTERDGRRSR